jgi:hypothetical protein
MRPSSSHGEVAIHCRRALIRRVQIALKPASKTLGLHRVFVRGKGLEYAIAIAHSDVCKSTPARAGSILASIIGAALQTNGMTDDRR